MIFDKKKYIQASGELFTEVQSKRIFKDSKTFVDSIPRDKPADILKEYKKEKDKPDFDLKNFITDNFFLPEEEESELNLPEKRSMEEHIAILWDYLIRMPQSAKEYSTLIPLIGSYIIPGGRFREVYYWDSYFTMLGLFACGRHALIKKMVDNFSYLVENFGFIPNGNRVYYLSRSQPPFYSLMLGLLRRTGVHQKHLQTYAALLEREYDFWMKHDEEEADKKGEHLHTARIDKNVTLNRYYDKENIPREESFHEDLTLFSKNNKKENIYNEIRSGAESGWDFSSRWFGDGINLSTINTTGLIPVDLNCLLANSERMLAEMYNQTEETLKAEEFKERFELRLDYIRNLLWNEDKTFFTDFNFRENKQSGIYSLAGMFPLYFGFAENKQAAKAADILEKTFLKKGGLVATPYNTSQQWDAPNGWAPLQWISIVGLRNYGYHRLADKIKERWLKLNKSVFSKTGRMFEKYNVENLDLPGGGGEYPLQDGFGWTNGVAIALIKNLDREFIRKIV